MPYTAKDIPYYIRAWHYLIPSFACVASMFKIPGVVRSDIGTPGSREAWTQPRLEASASNLCWG